MGSLLITDRTSVDALKVVNYTGRSHAPLELQVDVQIYKQRGRNAFFICSVAGYRDLATIEQQKPLGVIPAEPESEESCGIQESWEGALKELLHSTRLPCILVVRDWQLPLERIVCANIPWYNLYEYEESEVAGKSFSQIS